MKSRGGPGCSRILCLILVFLTGYTCADGNHSNNTGVSPACEPDIIIIGAARSHTSWTREWLATFPGVSVGQAQTEQWDAAAAQPVHLPNKAGLRKRHSRSRGPPPDPMDVDYMCNQYHPSHIVATSPWLWCAATNKTYEQMLAKYPQARFVLLLRNPVERFISNFYHTAKSDRVKKKLQFRSDTTGTCFITHNFSKPTKSKQQLRVRGTHRPQNSPCQWAHRFGGWCNENLVDYRFYLQQVIDWIPFDRLWIQIVEKFDESAQGALAEWLGLSKNETKSKSSVQLIPHMSKPAGAKNPSPRTETNSRFKLTANTLTKVKSLAATTLPDIADMLGVTLNELQSSWTIKK